MFSKILFHNLVLEFFIRLHNLPEAFLLGPARLHGKKQKKF